MLWARSSSSTRRTASTARREWCLLRRSRFVPRLTPARPPIAAAVSRSRRRCASSDHSTLFITTDMLLPSGYYVDCARGIWWTQVQRDVKSGCPVTARVPVVVFGAHSIISKKDCKTLKLGLDRVEGRSYVRTQLWIVAWRQMAPSPGTVFARNRISHSTSSTLLWNASLFLRLPI